MSTAARDIAYGLAAGDFNGDGLLDVHGTSTTEEPDTLFLQQKEGVFVDVVRAAGLYEPTYSRRPVSALRQSTAIWTGISTCLSFTEMSMT